MRRLFVGLAAATLVLLTFIVVLGVSTSHRLERVVTEQFNQQQLAVARQVAQNIEHRFASLRNHLLVLGELMAKMPLVERDAALLQQSCLECFGLLDLQVYKDSSLEDGGLAPGMINVREGVAVLLATARDLGPGRVAMSKCFRAEGRWVQLMAAVFPGGVSGGLVGVLDPLAIAGEAAGPIRSGQTGYAFVLSQEGILLAHYEDDFVGQDAFTVRAQRTSLISFDRINRIQADGMLGGREGTDWFESGWHRGQTGRIRKLIAYTPAHLDRDQAFWSVAVVAPSAEVHGAIAALQTKQWTLAGLALLLVGFGFGSAAYLAARWSQLLTAKVHTRTAELRRSENALRIERDRAEESLRLLAEAQGRLIRAERLGAIGEATAKVCHEIKNRLVIIGGFSRQLMQRVPEGAKERAKLDIIVEEVSRLESLLAEVSNFSKPSRLELRPVDVNDLLTRLHTLLGEQLASQGIQLRLSIAPSIPAVLGDSQKLEQVLINLIKNAGEAMPEMGTITLAARRESDWVCLEVMDTGEGIPAESLEEIFIPFFTTKKKGSGLGLSVCRKIVQDHGGHIEVTSKPAEGSTFAVLLPVVES